MFKLAKERIVTWPVTIRIPSADGSGKTEDHEAKVKYLLLTKDDMKQVAANALDEKKMFEVYRRHIVGWEPFATDADTGAPIEYSEANLRALIKIPYIDRALVDGLMQASNGRAAAKN